VSTSRPSISVKLSALHPRFEALSRDQVMTELAPRALELARMARARDLNLTVTRRGGPLELTLT
jgi:Proline dehydrogenase